MTFQLEPSHFQLLIPQEAAVQALQVTTSFLTCSQDASPWQNSPRSRVCLRIEPMKEAFEPSALGHLAGCMFGLPMSHGSHLSLRLAAYQVSLTRLDHLAQGAEFRRPC